ncbi:hypothetical protein CDO29_08510 [Sinorhizobium meliloti]|nr:hypothetical protein CDO29_08510 [Sinorhizobium meliloti]
MTVAMAKFSAEKFERPSKIWPQSSPPYALSNLLGMGALGLGATVMCASRLDQVTLVLYFFLEI